MGFDDHYGCDVMVIRCSCPPWELRFGPSGRMQQGGWGCMGSIRVLKWDNSFSFNFLLPSLSLSLSLSLFRSLYLMLCFVFNEEIFELKVFVFSLDFVSY